MNILKKHGLKETKTRVEILELLEKETLLNAEQMFERLQDSKVKISSIYRNLATFTDENILIRTVGLDNISYYQLNTDDHVHQIVCEECGKVDIVDHGPLMEIERDIEEKTGFTITSHSFEFSGLCEECAKHSNK